MRGYVGGWPAGWPTGGSKNRLESYRLPAGAELESPYETADRGGRRRVVHRLCDGTGTSFDRGRLRQRPGSHGRRRRHRVSVRQPAPICRCQGEPERAGVAARDGQPQGARGNRLCQRRPEAGAIGSSLSAVPPAGTPTACTSGAWIVPRTASATSRSATGPGCACVSRASAGRSSPARDQSLLWTRLSLWPSAFIS